jgi:hypothetical protein
VADETDKREPLSSPSALPSASPPLDQSLVRVFGALEQVLGDLTTSSQNVNTSIQACTKIVHEVKRLVESHQAGNAKHQELVLGTMIELLGSVERLSQQENVQVEAIDDARNALIAAKEQLVVAKKEFKDATGSQEISGPDDAPKEVHFVVKVITNLGWKHKKKVIAVIGTIATAAWTYAAPDIIAAFKTLLGGG